ncbi:MAG TPA: TRAP transporter small permease [Casimicrobiaceae bacterium]|nr:TRAP transporter small permease [Casimicrobiaceae bacterium]
MRRGILDVVDGGIRHLENFLAIALLVAIVVDVSLQVLFRYVLSHSLSWSSELATYMFAWLTLLGMAIAQREHAHIEVQFFGHLGPGVRVALGWIAWAASLAFFALLQVGGYLFFAGETIQSGPATGLPLWAVYSSLPIGATLGLFHVLRDLSRVRHPDRSARPDLHAAQG